MSIIWEVVGAVLSGLPLEKFLEKMAVKLPADRIVEKPAASLDTFDEENFQGLLERNPRFSDPIYKQNLQRLIERNRRFEEDRNEPHS